MDLLNEYICYCKCKFESKAIKICFLHLCLGILGVILWVSYNDGIMNTSKKRLRNEKFFLSFLVLSLSALITSIAALLGIIYPCPSLILGLLVNQTVTFLVIQVSLCEFIINSMHSNKELYFCASACVVFLALTVFVIYSNWILYCSFLKLSLREKSPTPTPTESSGVPISSESSISSVSNSSVEKKEHFILDHPNTVKMHTPASL